MTPREFFESVAKVNAEAALDDPGDLRLAVNAILTLDAFFGLLHAFLDDCGRVKERADDQWKELLARENKQYRILRDTAYALKHGKLVRAVPRLVRRPDQLLTMPGAFQANAFQRNAFQVQQVWIETQETDYRANEVIRDAFAFATEHLMRLD